MIDSKRVEVIPSSTRSGKPVKDAGNPWLAIVFLAVIPVMIPINIIVWKIAVGH